MQTANYNIRLDKNLKEQAFSVFESYGLNPSQAIKLFLNQVAQTREIPLSFNWKKDYTPNETTIQAIKEVEENYSTLTRCSSVEEVMKELEKIANE